MEHVYYINLEKRTDRKKHVEKQFVWTYIEEPEFLDKDINIQLLNKDKNFTILFNLCGHGHFDMKAYGDYFEGSLAEDKFDKGSMDKALEDLPKIA